MNPSNRSGNSHKPTLSRSLKEEVLEYFEDQGGEVKETAVYIHFVLDHHEEIPDILEAFVSDGLIQRKREGQITLTGKGKKALEKLRKLKA